MNYTYLLIILNIFFYVISLKFFFHIFKMKYKFPFRTSDLFTFFLNLILFSMISFYYIPDKFLIFFFINLNLFYIFFHILNMIITSPRTRIILDLKNMKNHTISINNYDKKYNCKVIANNRVKRLLQSNQILRKGNYYYLIEKRNFLFLISKIFSFIHKI